VTNIDYVMLERIADQRRFEPRTLDVAKRLFVYGETPKAVSTQTGVYLPRVYAIRREVLAAAQALARPEGWEELTLVGPRDVIQRVRQMFEVEMANVPKRSNTDPAAR
jgi:hypothetical protein